MALVTYILLAAVHSGLQSKFHPEILGVTASTAIVVLLLDFTVVKFGCYILNIQVSPAFTFLHIHLSLKFVLGRRANAGPSSI